MSELLWFNAGEGSQRLKEIGILEWLCHVRVSSTLGRPRKHTFTNRTRPFLKNSVITILCRPGENSGNSFIVETIVTDLENLNAMVVIGSWVAEAKW